MTCHGCEWNGDKKTGDVIDVVRRRGGCDFRSALERLGRTISGKSERKTSEKGQAADEEFNAAKAGKTAHSALMRNPTAITDLRSTRGIDEATVRRFRIGITGKLGNRYWTFPITDETGRVVAVKHHRADGQKRKSFWQPGGARRDHLFPVHLEPKGAVWLCPGELKALAVAASGRGAIGITSGEGSANGKVMRPTDLPAQAIAFLSGRSVALPPDADNAGVAWAEHALDSLTDAGIDARIVGLPLDASAGLKDISDYVVQLQENGKDANGVAASLDEAWRRADPWYGTLIGHRWSDPRMWQPVEPVTTGLRDLDRLLNGGLRTRGVHMICGKTSQGKTQVAVTMAVNAAIAGIPVCYLSLELGADEVAQLVAAQLADVPRNVLARGKVNNECDRRLQAVMKQHRGLPLTILDDEHWPTGLTRDNLGKLIATGVKRHLWRLIVLDYLGLLVPLASDRDPFTSDVMNSTELRRLARKGASFKQADGLTIDDLAGAGRLVYDAQNVFSVWCESANRQTGLVDHFSSITG